MDTKQLAAFCAVVERSSFSQAADQLGVTQPAVSLQIRSLEQRVGQRLLDRSGRRVEPTEAGLRLYRGAQRLLALEQQLLADLGDEAEGELKGRLEIGASTGPGGSVLPVILGEFQQLHPLVTVALTVSDTQRVVEQVGRRELELGIVGVAGRHRGVTFEPFYRDEVVLAVPAGHKRAGKSMTLEELKAEPLVLMQEGAGIRQMIDEELRELGLRLRDLNVKLELGLQESARAAVLGGFGATFISRIAIEGDLAAGALAIARVEGLEPARDVQLARASGRAETRVAQEFVRFARERLPGSFAGAWPRCRKHGPRPGCRRRCSSRARAGTHWSCRFGLPRAGARCRRIASVRRSPPRRAQTAWSPSAAGVRSISGRRSPLRRDFRSSPSRRRMPAQSGPATSASAIPGDGCGAAAAGRAWQRSSTTRS